MPSIRQDTLLIVAMCVVAVLILNPVLTVGAVLPTLIDDWHLSNAEGGWLNGIFFAGYIAAVPWLTSMTDRLDPKRMLLLFAGLSAVVALVFGLWADDLWVGLVLRVLSGVGLAGTYSTGLKALADCFEGPRQARAVAYYSSSYSIGTAFSIFLGGSLEAWFGWRWSFIGAGIACLVVVAIVAAMLPARRPDPAKVPAGHVLDFRPVLRNRDAMTYILMYLGHVWEMFGNRMWLVAFFTYVVALHPATGALLKPSDLAALVAICAVPAAMAMGELSSGRRQRWFLGHIMVSSAVVGCIVGFTAPLPIYWVVALSALYSITAFADTGILSAGLIAAAEPNRRGATMAIQGFVANLGGLAAPVMVGVTLDLVGGYDLWLAWGLAFAVMGLGSAFGAAVLFVRTRR